jgi:hypothetical protein
MHYDLLSVDRDAKTKKGKRWGFLTAVLYMSPALEADGIHDMCGGRSKECTKTCLHISGNSEIYPHILEARRRKTLDYLENFDAFVQRLSWDTDKLIRDAENRGLKPCERPNGTTDQPKLARAMAKRFPFMPFYDYSKLDRAWERTMENYHITFSFSGENYRECDRAMDHGLNVAVVFRGGLPKTWRGVPVIDGDKSDLRFKDPAGVVVGLKEKGRRIRQLPVGGFVQIGAKPRWESTCVATRQEVEKAMQEVGR